MSYSLLDSKRLRALMEASNIDGLIVMAVSNQDSPMGTKNLFYVTGFSGFNGGSAASSGFNLQNSAVLIPKIEEPVFICCETGFELFKSNIWIKDIRTFPDHSHTDRLGESPREPGPPGSKPEGPGMQDPYTPLVDAIKEKGLSKGRLGIDMHMTVYQYQRLMKTLPNAEFINVSSPPLSSKTIWWQMRMIKSKDEIDKLRKAAKVSEAGLQAMIEVASEWREREVTIGECRKAYMHAVIDLGCVPCYPPGASACPPPNVTSVGLGKGPEDVLKEGDILECEFNVNYKAYASDLHRDFCCGKPSKHALDLANVLETAQQKVKEAIVLGAKFSDLFLIGQNTVREMDFPQYTRGFCGHSIGLGLEEPPFISFQETEVVRPGMVLSVEIPYYIRGLYGMCPEDNGLVTEKGFESFSKLPCELVSLPIKK